MLRGPSVALAVSLLTSTFVFSRQAPNQSRNRVDEYSIHGRVVLPTSQETDQRIEVNLEKSELQVIQITYTDAGGNFGFNNLAPGVFYVSVRLEGYEPVHQLVEISTTFGRSSVTIFLAKPAVTLLDKPTGLDADDPDVVDVTQMKDRFPRKAVQDYEKAIDEKQKGRVDNAIKLLEEAIKLAPDFFHAHNNLGILYQAVKRYGEAESEFKRSHQLSPKTERPLVNLGSLYIEQSNLEKTDKEASGKLLDQALDALEEAVKLNPRSAPAYFLLGQANYKSSFWEEAATAFKKVMALDPKLTSARLMLANVYVKQEKWQDVIDSLDAYLKENPKATDRANVEQMRDSILKTLQASNK
jgi:cytochrome c-type biogenesis protein CcmH/NrfG